MKKFLIALSLIVLLVGFVFFGWRLSQPDPVSDSAEPQLQAGVARPTAGTNSVASTLKPQLPPPSSVLPSLPPMAVPLAPVHGDGGPVRDPIRDMMKKQVQVEIKSRYADVFSQFKLSAEQEETLTKILAERTMPGAEPGPGAEGENAGQVSPARQASDEALLNLFGNETDFQKFLKLEDTLSERMQIKKMGGLSQFESAGAPLTKDQEELLYAVMASTARSVAVQNSQAGAAVEDGVAGLVLRNEQLMHAIAKEAERVLNPVQLGVLKQMHEKTITELKRGLATHQSAQ